MASVNTLCKIVLNVKNTVIENCNLYSDEDGVKHIRIKARPNKWHENDCPFCHKSCPVYNKHSSRPTTWRGLDWGGVLVEVEYQTHRIICPEHGVYVAEVPCKYLRYTRKHVACDMLRRFCVASATKYRCKSVRIPGSLFLLYRTQFPIK